MPLSRWWRQIYGAFGAKSFAGDQPECRDLYLEETFRLFDDGQWAPMEDTGGVLIMPEQIASIEFRKFVEMNQLHRQLAAVNPPAVNRFLAGTTAPGLGREWSPGRQTPAWRG